MKGKKDQNGNEPQETQENKIVITKDSSLVSYRAPNHNNPKTEKKLWPKILVGIFTVLLIGVIGVILFSKYILGFINYKEYDDKKNQVIVQDEEFDTDDSASNSKLDKLDPNDVEWNSAGGIKKVEGVTNILFIAEEREEDEIRGRSDVILIVTVNTNDKTVKLTSILRDTYVQIPGYRDNRINSAYRTGDVPLLETALKENFGIQVDGYVKVDFDGFSELIDKLGGVEVTLTPEEADWLNEGNHVRDKYSRNLTAGTHRLNGAQALGYTRIRRIKTVDGLAYDFGRVWRQKLVLTNLFNDYKDQSLSKIVSIASKVLSLVTSDLSQSKIMSLAMTAFDLDVEKIQTLCVPIEGSYESRSIRGMDVLVPDLEENTSAINSFVYGTKFEPYEEWGDTTVIPIEKYQIDFSLKESNFRLKSINSETKVALETLKGYRKLTLEDVLAVRYKSNKNK